MKEMFDRLSDRLAEFEIFKPGGMNAKVAAAAVGGGVVLIAIIAWAALRKSPPPPSMPLAEGTPWICKNGDHFTLTSQQLAEHNAKHPGEPMPCPICGAEANRAVTCPHCGKLVVPGPAPDHLCPECKKAINHY